MLARVYCGHFYDANTLSRVDSAPHPGVSGDGGRYSLPESFDIERAIEKRDQRCHLRS